MSTQISTSNGQITVTRTLKSTKVAYIWWIFLGGIGAHQFYLGNTGRGLLHLFTLGLLGVMTVWDLFTLPSQVRRINSQIITGVR